MKLFARALALSAILGTSVLIACGSDEGSGASTPDASSADASPDDATVAKDGALPGGDSGNDGATISDASDASSGADGSDAAGKIDGSDADVADASDASDANDASDASDPADASDAADTGDAAEAGNAPLVETPIKLAAGDSVACSIDATGALKCWGRGKNTPQPILAGTTWREVEAGRDICGIMNDDSLWCWSAWAAPSQPDTGTFQTVTVGYAHHCAISTLGALYCWGGSNIWGELGVGDTNSHSTLTRVGSANDWAQVSAGDNHTCALKTNGALYCWGQNLWGQLGNNGTSSTNSSPIAIASGMMWKQVRLRTRTRRCPTRRPAASPCRHDRR